MPFNASNKPPDLEQRFSDVDFEVVDVRAWEDFLYRLSSPELQQEPYLDVFDQFLEAAGWDL
jgi:hypothetical protein